MLADAKITYAAVDIAAFADTGEEMGGERKTAENNA